MASLRGRVDAVAIGASAGGVEALGRLAPAFPANMRPAVFIVQHLPAERASVLAGLLGARAVRPVREAEDKEPVQPGVVYLAPPGYHLLVDDGRVLALSCDPPVNYSRPSIDVLFESAADAYGSRLAAVLLTGANHDGAAGLEAVQRAGGLTVVQDPHEAQVETMVRAAMARIKPDWELTLDGIAALLATLDEGTAA